jgi:CubicO group peptidase (beta-lactamase class C family)
MQITRSPFIGRFLICFLSHYILFGSSGAQDKPFQWTTATPESQGLSSDLLEKLSDSLARKGTKKLMIIKNDKLVYQWFEKGWEDTVRTHYSASLAKALVGGMALLTTLNDKILYPDMPVCLLIPEWKNSAAKSKITIRQLATHTSGLEDAEVNEAEQALMREKGLHTHMDLSGWKGQFWKQDKNPFVIARDSVPILFTPGTHFNYSNPGIAMLSYATSAAIDLHSSEDLHSTLWNRVYNPLGIKPEEINIGYGKKFDTKGLALVPSWGGASFTANAVARLARLMLSKGNWNGTQVFDSLWIDRVTRYGHTAIAGSNRSLVSENYSLRTKDNSYPATTMGWYSNFDGIWNHVPKDAFAGAGAGHQVVLVIPSLNMIVVRFGADLADSASHEGFWLAAEKHLFNPIMDAIIESSYPVSMTISGCEFAPANKVIRLAEGSDNWPMTWSDDGNLYTAYGDGYGFKPYTEIKFSLGLARIAGRPAAGLEGINLRSTSGDRVGQGRFGAKASGLLSIGGTLYMLVRNTANAQLAWSEDHGHTWEWADWTFAESFGCPTFLNYGKDYDGALDEYVYIYSPEASTAYDVADNMVLARVYKHRLKEQRAYSYFSGFDSDQNPTWQGNIKYRVPVFSNPAKCYRSGITYNAALQKFLWCQIIPLATETAGPRFAGGLGIFESDYPWGPWRTVYYTRRWDIGPGETMTIPSKWISTDGKTAHLVFSGDDYFSVRKIQFLE